MIRQLSQHHGEEEDGRGRAVSSALVSQELMSAGDRACDLSKLAATRPTTLAGHSETSYSGSPLIYGRP